jgi:hypothetical protein
MSNVEVPYDDAVEPDELRDAEVAELGLEAPEADAVDQHVEVELDDDEYR